MVDTSKINGGFLWVSWWFSWWLRVNTWLIMYEHMCNWLTVNCIREPSSSLRPWALDPSQLEQLHTASSWACWSDRLEVVEVDQDPHPPAARAPSPTRPRPWLRSCSRCCQGPGAKKIVTATLGKSYSRSHAELHKKKAKAMDPSAGWYL